MKLIDTHTHINLRAFKDDAEDTIQRALDAGVAVVNVGTQIDTSKQAVELLGKFEKDVYAVVGLHPVHTYAHDFIDEAELPAEGGPASGWKTREEGFDYEVYKELTKHERVVGIGECGLDYYRLPEGRDPEEIKTLQKKAFELQIKLAVETNKALCVHCRPSDGTSDAYLDLYKMLRDAQDQYQHELVKVGIAHGPADEIIPFRFEVHCFTGDLQTAQMFVGIGGYIGLNGIITFDKTSRSEEVVKGIPLEKIVLETDAPYLSPKSKRGKRNEPAYLQEVAEKIAEWKDVSVEEVMETTTKNAKKLFNLD